MKEYIIEIISLGKPTYYTSGSCDPCRTTIPYSAQFFDSEQSAKTHSG